MMGLIAKSESGIEFKKLEDGVYTAVSSMLIDLGIQNNEKFGKKQRKIIIVWQIIGETIEIDEEEKPRIISKEYTLSLNEKSTLRKDLQAWRGKAFSLEELEGFDLVNILNKPCQIQIINEERNNKTYPNVVAIMAMPKGTTTTNAEEIIYFNTYEKETFNNFVKIPKWIQDKIRNCENKAESQLDLYINEYDVIMKGQNNNSADKTEIPNYDSEVIQTDDLPF